MVGPQEPVVTGDAVILEVQLAQVPVRALSALIDVTVIFLCYVVGVLLWATTLSQFDSALSSAVLIIFTVLALLGYPVIFETATRGRTLGKIAMGLRVVSDDGGPERFRQALFRGLAGIIEIWMLTGGPAVICSLISPKGKRIGDIFAGTVVISERAPRLTPPPLMPPQLAWWASSLQLSGLGTEQAELGPSVPFPRITIESAGARRHGVPDHRRRRRPHLTPTTTRRAGAADTRRRPRRTPPPGAGAAAGSCPATGLAHAATAATREPAVRVSGCATATVPTEGSVARARRLHPAVLKLR